MAGPRKRVRAESSQYAVSATATKSIVQSTSSFGGSMKTTVMMAIQTMATTFTSGAARPSVHGVYRCCDAAEATATL